MPKRANPTNNLKHLRSDPVSGGNADTTRLLKQHSQPTARAAPLAPPN